MISVGEPGGVVKPEDSGSDLGRAKKTPLPSPADTQIEEMENTDKSSELLYKLADLLKRGEKGEQ